MQRLMFVIRFAAHRTPCWSTIPRHETFCARPSAALPRDCSFRRADYVARRCYECCFERLPRASEHPRDGGTDDAFLSEMDSGRAWADWVDQLITGAAHICVRTGRRL